MLKKQDQKGVLRPVQTLPMPGSHSFSFSSCPRIKLSHLPFISIIFFLKNPQSISQKLRPLTPIVRTKREKPENDKSQSFRGFSYFCFIFLSPGTTNILFSFYTGKRILKIGLSQRKQNLLLFFVCLYVSPHMHEKEEKGEG